MSILFVTKAVPYLSYNSMGDDPSLISISSYRGWALAKKKS